MTGRGDADPARQYDFFDRFTPSYEDSRVDFMVRELQKLPDGARVLDLGCGDGSVMTHLAERVPGIETAGIDPSPAYVERATAAGLDVQIGSVLEPSLADQTGRDHDAVLIVAVLHHLVGTSRRESMAYCRRAIEAAADLVRPGGLILIYEPTYRPRLAMHALFLVKALAVRAFGNRRIELGRPWLNVGAPLVSYYDVDHLTATLADLGLDLISTETVSAGSVARIAKRQSVGLVVRRP